MPTNQEKRFTFKQRGRGIRKNLTTYFSVRILQGFAITILFYFFINTSSERQIAFKYIVWTLPVWVVMGTMLFESIRVIIEEQIRIKREKNAKKKETIW